MATTCGKVLVVTNTPHLPTTSGYSQRVAAVVAALAGAGYQVRTISIKPLTEPENLTQPALAGYPRALAARGRVLTRLVTKPSISLAKWYSPGPVMPWQRFTMIGNPIVVLESTYLAPYQVLFNCPVVFDLHNIESQLIGNYAKDRSGLIALGAQLESKLLERLEAAIPQLGYGVATVSQADRDTLQALGFRHRAGKAANGGAEVVAAPNGVSDAAFLVPDGLADAAAPTAVFIGHLGWRPNIDGARWLATEVWPLVHQQLPNARLQLIGRDPHPSVLELANASAGVAVHGNVDSVLPYLSQVAVATAPLWTAGGTRLKILEALGTGTPVVATSLGALGLTGLESANVLDIADTPASFASALVTHLAHPAKSSAARAAAEPFRWANALAPLVSLVNRARR